MAWYDVFSRFYDASLEPLYREQRARAAEMLRLEEGSFVLDLPCGTGQSFSKLAAAGRVVGVDLSDGMLREAKRRVERDGLRGVSLLAKDAATLTIDDLGGAAPDRLHVFLGMTVFPDHEAVFERLWSVLAPGGRCVIVDVHAAEPRFQGKMVEWLARADLRRRFWEPLERRGAGYVREDLTFDRRHGGQIMIAAADKPA
ncbi:MAG: methyltransferase domain-containing protein [Labilithrix sp.]|nr:methyltransferase domain-containing protein [Labilithrix sp.]MCW5815750.1 methyltransferase domain-containing protein [Labilithrix sp.]